MIISLIKNNNAEPELSALIKDRREAKLSRNKHAEPIFYFGVLITAKQMGRFL